MLAKKHRSAYNAPYLIFFHMNYLILKSVVETTLAHFSCKDCQTKATDKDVRIIGNGGNSIQLEIHCSHCGSIGMVKAEIGMVNQSSEE